MISFESTLRKVGKSMIVQLPEDVSLKLPSRGQVMVKGTINDHDLQQVLEPDGRWGHWFRLNSDLLKATGLKLGDSVTIKMSPSKDWPEPTIPKDVALALNDAPQIVQVLWSNITTMARWEWIRWINATNVMETRDRRVEVSISKLKSGKRRPCCFNLAACTDPELSKNGRLIEPNDGM